MSITHAFPEKELEERIHTVREEMKKNNLDGIVVAVPENIYYLTGLFLLLGISICFLWNTTILL